MRFSTNKKELSEAVGNIQRVVATKTTIPALEGILLEAKDGVVTLSAYDMEIGMKTTIPASVGENGKIVLGAKIFSEIVRKSPSDIVEITIDDKRIASIVSGASNFSIIGMDADEFPELPDVGNVQPIVLDGETLKSMIRQTIFAVSESDAKPVHQGSLFNIKDGTLEVVSVDGFRLALRREKVNVANNTNFVVPGKTLGEVLKLVKEGDVEIYPGKRHIMFKIENYTVTSSILEGDFLDYNAAIPKMAKTKVTVNTRKFIESTERVSLIISDRLKSPIRCIFEDDGIRLSCTTAVGRAYDRFEAALEGDLLEMGFNNKYLLDALRNTECDEITLSMGGALSPMVVAPKDSDSFLFLVLPVRLKSE